MHPVLAHYLDLQTALETLQKADGAAELSNDERLFADVARNSPERRGQLLSAAGKKRPPTEVQEALVYLAAHTAARAIQQDASLQDAVQIARTALVDEGANEADVNQFLASIVLEEAFGYEHEADDFDQPFFEETLKSVAELARLTQERVKQLVLMFIKSGDAADRPAFGSAAQALIEAAWEDGPEPINPEHVEAALETARAKTPEKQLPQLFDGMRRFVAFLGRSGIVGPLRQAELTRAVERAAMDVPGARGVKN
ncbi:MAG: hypothetical protein ACJ790_16460 [Myxococcaceae bacterium]